VVKNAEVVSQSSGGHLVMIVIYYCVAVCNSIAIHNNVMFTIYGAHHFGCTHINRPQQLEADGYTFWLIDILLFSGFSML
jgi:hypothetical protein